MLSNFAWVSSFCVKFKITIEGTAQGQIEIDLFEDVAPLHVAQILNSQNRDSMIT